MYTYQDLEKIIESGSEKEKINFIRDVIIKHEDSDEFKIAKDANEYFEHRNVTITNFQKILFTVTGKQVEDKISPNFKMASKFFFRFVTQENQYLLSNGVTWEKGNTADKLGTKKYNFDYQLQDLGRKALIGGVAFGFWNLDHIEVFALTEFAPLYDEETGALRAGVRFWQIDESKPLRATLYEEDGYTEYIWKTRVVGQDTGEVFKEKRTYVLHTKTSEADGTEIVNGDNYPTFPIVPLWGNPSHQSEIVGLREQIDCYDLIKSGFANTVDEASYIYWTLQNAGGMDDIDLATFVNRLKTLHAVAVDDNVRAESHAVDVPVEGRETLLTRLRADLYEDAMALDTKSLASGGSVVTAVIKAAYEPLDQKCNDYEFQVLKFVNTILELAGLDDKATFTRSKIINVQEDVSVILQAADHLTPDYVTKKILTYLGDGDQAEKMLNELETDELNRFNMNNDNNNDDETNNEGNANIEEV